MRYDEVPLSEVLDSRFRDLRAGSYVLHPEVLDREEQRLHRRVTDAIASIKKLRSKRERLEALQKERRLRVVTSQKEAPSE